MGIRVLYCSLMPGWVQAMRLEADLASLDADAAAGSVQDLGFHHIIVRVSDVNFRKKPIELSDHCNFAVTGNAVYTAALHEGILSKDLLEIRRELHHQTHELRVFLGPQVWRLQEFDEPSDPPLACRQSRYCDWLDHPNDGH